MKISAMYLRHPFDILLKLRLRQSELTDRNTVLTVQSTAFEDQLAALQNSCNGGAGSGSGAQTALLHADHLGRPVLATDITGAII